MKNSFFHRFCVVLFVLATYLNPMYAERVSLEDAATVASNFMNASANSVTGSQSAKRMVLKKSTAANQPQFYIYENADGEGWVMVAANDVVTPILAYSLTGTYNTINQPDNLRHWLGHYDAFIKRMEVEGITQTEETAAKWNHLRKAPPSTAKGTIIVGPLVETKWDQDAPYNNLTPGTGNKKSYTGCVATAMAQVMKFWEWPETGKGSHTYQPVQEDSSGDTYILYSGNLTANFGTTTYDWANMKNSYTGSPTTAQKTAVATLMYHCGVATEMMYGSDDEGGSGTYTLNYGSWTESDNAQNALYNYFRYKKATGYMRDGYKSGGKTYYSSWTDAAWTAMIKEELDKHHPIMYGGAGSGGGHSFICDGYDSEDYFHFNWGWSGSNDGWYVLSNLVPGSGGAGGGSYDFSEDQDVIINIVPDKPNITITWSVQGATSTTTQTSGTLVLPATTPSNCTSGKKFVGWTEQSTISGGTRPSDLFTSGSGITVTGNKTYYAVYATASSGGGSGTPEKASSIAIGDEIILVAEGVSYKKEMTGFSTTSTIYGTVADYSSTPAGTYTFVVEAGSSTGTYALKHGSVYANWASGNSLSSASSITENSSWNISISDGNATISNVKESTRVIKYNSSSPRFACYTSGQSAVQLYKVGAGTSYSDYSTTCSTCTLSSITLNTDAVAKTFTQGDTFSSEGLVVTAKYNDCSDRTVSPTSVSEPDMTTTGSKTVTVTYTEGSTTRTATYTITVNPLPTYTIRFFDGTTQIGSNQTVTQGQSATKPSNPADCTDNGYTFVGWYTSKLADDNTTVTSGWITDFTAIKGQDYYAVYSHTEDGGSGNSTTYDLVLTGDNFVQSYNERSSSATANEVGGTGTFTVNFASSGVMKSSNPGHPIQLRKSGSGAGILYNTNDLGTINSITYGSGSTNNIASTYKGSSEQPTSDGTGGYFKITNGSSVSYITSISINFTKSTGGSSTTYYTGTKNCVTPTEVTVTFHKNDGSDATTSQTIPYNTATALTANTFSRTGYEFMGWATSASGSKAYDDLTPVTLTKNTNLYALWQKKSYNVTFTPSITNGTVTVNSQSSSPQSAEFESTVTVTVTPASGYLFGTLVVKDADDNTLTLSGEGNTRSFTMPASNVTVTATVTAIPTYNAVWSVNGSTTTQTAIAGTKLSELTPAIPEPTSSSCDNVKVFVGWTTNSDFDGTDAADIAAIITSTADLTMPAGGTTYYAVFATESTGGGSAALTKLGSESTFTEGDHIVIVAKGTTYALYQETVSTSYVKNWSFENDATIVGSDTKNYLTLSAGTTSGKWYMGDATNGYLYNTSSGNELYVKTDGTKAEWSITWNETKSAFIILGGRNLSCRTDLTGNNANKYRSANGTGTGTAFFDIYKYTIGGGTTYSEYTTSCVTYEVTAVPNNALYGTVAVDGYKITATPAEGYVADGYTVTSGTATVTQNGNLYSVVPTSDCNITIKFRKATEYTVTFVDNNTSYPQTAYEGTPFELPEEGLSTCPDATFLGWVQGSYTDHATGTKTTPVYVSPGAETDITSATTFTAVYGITAPTDKYKALKAESELESGANYILAGYYSSTDYLMKGTMSSERIDAVSGSLTVGDEGNEVTDPLLVWRINILDKATKSISLYNAAAGKYLSIDAGNHIQLADEAFAFNYTTDDSGSAATWEFNSSGDASYMLSFYSTYHQFNAYTSNSVNLYLYKQMIGMSLYTSHPECCYDPAEALTIESDVETIVGSGTAQLSLTGGNGRPITWTTTGGTLSGQTNTAATLTLTTPGVYTVTATQEEDNTDADHVICGKEVSVTITVKAQWTITYKTIEEGIENTHNTAIVTDGASYTLPDISEEFTCPSGITFAGWASNKTATSVEQAAGTSQTASADATWYAVWTEGVSSGETVYLYEQVLSSSALAAGDKVIFVDKDKTVGLAEQADNNRRTGEVTANPDNADQLYFLSTSGVEELTVGKDGDYFTFHSHDGYLYAASSSANHLKSQTTLSNNGKWTVTITDGSAVLTAQGTNTRNQLRYNSSSHIFSCYSSGQQDITIWKKTTATKYITTVSTGVSTTDNTCQSGAIIRAEAEQWITAAKGQKVKRVYEVKALGFDAAVTLTVVGNTDPHFTATLGESSIPAAPGRLETTLTVEYLPTDADVTNTTAITLSAGSTTKTLTVNGRSLPDEFLVITKKTIWYALPANMNAGDKQYEGVVVTPDDAEEPTSVAVAPSTIVYGLRSVDDSRYADNGTCVRLAGNGDKALWANTAAGAITIQNNEAVGSPNDEAYDWLLNTTDGIHYTIANPHHADYANGRVLAFGDKFGQYKTETVFFLVPAECNSQPQEVNVSARRVDATFSWESNASSMAIDVYSDAEMTSLALSATATTVPHYMTGLTESTDYWFRLTPDGEAACAITGTFKTTGPTIDIAEWKEDAVVVAVDKDNDFHPSIVIDGEVEHGISGTVATEIFFSKYFEGAGDMKLVAIFNGTSNDISLADYSLYTKNCSAPKSNDDIASSSFGNTTDYPISALGTIQSGQEIVFFTRPGSGTLADCSDEFLDGMAAQSGADDNPRWIECNNSTLYGGQKFPLMQFNGNDAICLKKNDALVDVIGSTGEPGKEKNCANRLNDLGWPISVKNIDYGKATDDPSFNGLYEASSKEPTTETERKAILTAFNIDLDNEYIDLTTARCILFRDKRVLSGDSAVLMNTGAGFVTCTNHSEFRSEWNGRAVCMTKDMQTTAGVIDDSKATCNSYQDLGEFDYSNYYKDWESIDPGQELDQYIKDPETMTYEIPIANLAQYSCLNLRFQLKNDADEVVTEAPVQVPIIVKGGHRTIDAIFNEIVKTDGGDPLYEQSINRCKTCDVVVLSDGVLTKESDGSTHDVAEVGNVKVYPGGQLIVPAGTSYSVNSLAFRRQEDEIATADIQGNLGIKASGKNVFLDIRIDPTNWHYISLPYDCKVSDIRFANDELKVPVLGTDYLLKWYDGEKRAATQSGGCWEMVKPDAVLKKGIGYIFALPGDGKVKREFRFPMANDVIADEKNNKTISGVYGFGCDKSDQELRPNDKGWNLIGAPYLMSYSSDITDPLRTGKLIRDPENPIYWTINPSTTALRYIVEPVDNGWSEYRQVAIAYYEMKPFTCYFVQIGGTDPAAEQGVAFNAAKVQRNSIVRRAPEEYEETEDTHPVWCAVSLTNAKGETDETTMLVSNDFTDGYDMMNDLVKMRGTYYQYAQITTRPVLASRNDEGEMAFNALPDASAESGIPLNYFAAQNGEYTIAYNDKYDYAQEVKAVMLLDKQTNEWTDLTAGDYTFTSNRTDNTDRFILTVRVKRKQTQTPTGFETPYDTQTTKKVLRNGHVYILRGGVLYDITGKKMLNY